MTSDITAARAGEAEGLLFDTWFDPIEDGLRAKVRGFIEAMIEEELTTALARPRYGRRSPGSDGGEAASPLTGHRHGRRTRRLTGTFGPTEIAVPRARLVGQDGTTREWKSAGLRAYQRIPHASCRCADRRPAGTTPAGRRFCSPPGAWAGRRPRLGVPFSMISSPVACAGRSSSWWTVRQVSSGR